jgi:hypothetical protein
LVGFKIKTEWIKAYNKRVLHGTHKAYTPIIQIFTRSYMQTYI